MKNSTKLLAGLSLVIGLSVQANAQVSFTNHASDLNRTYNSGVAVTINDANNDGLDDIVILDDARDLHIEFQGLNGQWTNLNTGETMDNGNAWGMAVGDASNNGLSDVFSGLFGGRPDYAKANASGTSYTVSELPQYSLATQCVNLADMDSDGDIDFFSCGDTGPSGIWENDGNGDFTYSGDDIIPMTPSYFWPAGTNAQSTEWDGSGNYGSTFTDYDLDGDLDFYITHCRQGVSNSNDPRRINQMFINDGNDNYTEDFTNANGLRIGAQSWTTDFQDFDNDGDFDAFMTNHDVDNMLLENQNGVFVDIWNGSGLDMTVGTPIQGLMRDFDNDMYVDVLVTGSGGTTYALYMNNGDKTFTRVDGVFSNGLYSIATGDLNHDGFLDVYGSYATIYTNPSNTPDAVWLNDGNNNNWLAVDLEGTISNRSAIGAVVRMYGPWGMQVREVRSGESYGICNSLTSYFGLAQNTEIDSVVVDWPSSGIHQVVEDPSPNQFLTIIENECVAPEAFITTNGETVLCQGETLQLEATMGAGYAYEWSDGSSGQSLTISEAGNYMVRVTDSNAGSACSSVSAVVVVEVSPDETPEVTALGDLSFCEGGSVTLTASEASAYNWSNGLGTTQSVEVTESGNYFVTATGVCDDFDSDPISVEVLAAPAPTANDVQIPVAGSANLTASGMGATFNWYDQASGGNPIGTGANFTTPTVSTSSTFWVEEVHSYPGAINSGGKVDRSANDGTFHQVNDYYMFFDVFEEMTLNSAKVYADDAGDRTINVLDENGLTVHTGTFTVPAGESRITFNWALSPGVDYTIRMDADNHGLWRDDDAGNVNYPYLLGDFASITGANTSQPRYYYYFYDWEVQGANAECVSEREEVVVSVGTVGVSEGELAGVKLYPNPTNGILNLEIPNHVEGTVQVELFDIAGNLVLTKNVVEGNNQLQLETLSAGMYMVRLLSQESTSSTRIVVE